LEFFNVKKLDEVKDILKTQFGKFEIREEKIDIKDLVGRIISKDIVSMLNIPDFNRSTVDGYGVKLRDVTGVSENNPAVLELIGSIDMGEISNIKTEKNETLYIPTGAHVPDSFDGVAMIEHCEVIDNEVFVYKPISNNENMVLKGDDVAKGELCIKKGTIIKPNHIAIIAALNYREVDVYEKIKVALISTGDELIEVGSKYSIGKIIDTNRYTISSTLQNMGCEIVLSEIVKDKYELVKDALVRSLKVSDIAIFSGGSSVGKLDFTSDVINEIGDPGVLVHGIAIKPGKPTIVGKVEDKIVFGLPGHPASCLVSLKLVVEEFIKEKLGIIENRKTIICKSAFQVNLNNGRDNYYMVKLNLDNGEYIAEAIRGTSGMVSIFSSADGYVRIPMEKEGVYLGETLEVHLF
jgi:molybdopterin molybdotransferase